MPYKQNSDLPLPVRKHLPNHAQDIYRSAFNHAFEEYQTYNKRRTKEPLEKIAHKVAWAAVKTKYQKNGDNWEEKSK